MSTLNALTVATALALGLPLAHAADLKLPMLPGAAVAQAVVNTALNSSSAMLPAPTPAPQASKPASFGTQAASSAVIATGRSSATGRSLVVHATAYNSEAGQTDATPFITATGTRTRPGVLAVSRDLLRVFPYGTRVRLDDLSGNSPWLSGRTFVVEDTMNARFTNRIDLWMGSRSEALSWGGRSVRITALR